MPTSASHLSTNLFDIAPVNGTVGQVISSLHMPLSALPPVGPKVA